MNKKKPASRYLCIIIIESSAQSLWGNDTLLHTKENGTSRRPISPTPPSSPTTGSNPKTVAPTPETTSPLATQLANQLTSLEGTGFTADSIATLGSLLQTFATNHQLTTFSPDIQEVLSTFYVNEVQIKLPLNHFATTAAADQSALATFLESLNACSTNLTKQAETVAEPTATYLKAQADAIALTIPVVRSFYNNDGSFITAYSNASKITTDTLTISLLSDLTRPFMIIYTTITKLNSAYSTFEESINSKNITTESIAEASETFGEVLTTASDSIVSELQSGQIIGDNLHEILDNAATLLSLNFKDERKIATALASVQTKNAQAAKDRAAISKKAKTERYNVEGDDQEGNLIKTDRFPYPSNPDLLRPGTSYTRYAASK